MKKLRITFGDLVPFLAFIVIFGFFAIASSGRMYSVANLRNILTQSLVTILCGCGMLFVVAQGSIDLSVGVNLALSGYVAALVTQATGLTILLIPTALLVGTVVGVFNGFVVSKLKVPSFMLTIAMLIGVRGIVNYFVATYGTVSLPTSMSVFSTLGPRFAVFIVIVAILAYVFEFTKVGRYSRAIGENETTAKFVGVPVTKMKIVAFGISGLMAGVGSIFSMTAIGSTSNTMGSFLEMQVAMAIFLGGVLVTGGRSAKLYKVVLGSLSITTIVNGLAVIGKADSQISESVEGILLLLILFITIVVSRRSEKREKTAAEVAEKATEAELEAK